MQPNFSHPLRLFISCLAAAIWLVTAKAVAGQAPGTCVAREANPETQEVTCTLQPMRRYRFRALFSGSHDDTLVTLSATAGGAALTCDTGSTTRLFGEDGEVQLTCLFSADRSGGVDITLVNRHAQFVSIMLEGL